MDQFTNKNSMIPWYLHQTFKSPDIPKKWIKYRESWVKNGDKWDYRFYDDNALRKVIVEHFPQYLESYDSFHREIERVDFARYAILYTFGGCYADLDMEQKMSFKNLMQSSKVLLASEPMEQTKYLYRRSMVLCNACMLSPPSNPFWIALMEYIIQNYNKKNGPVKNTGPLAITKFVEKTMKQDNTFKVNQSTYILWDYLTILPSCSLYSVIWSGNNSKYCKEDETIYAVHYWTNEWVKINPLLKEAARYVAKHYVAAISIFVVLIMIAIILGLIIYVIIKNK